MEMQFIGDSFIEFLRRPWPDQINALHALLVRFKTAVYYRRVFGKIGHGSLVYQPLFLCNPRFIQIGEHTIIRSGSRIEALIQDESRPPQLIIGDNVNIEQNVHLVCSWRLVIGSDVSITGHCAIVDTNHPFFEVDDPRKVGDRIDPNPTAVSIGDHTFLGFGCVVLPGVCIGRHCVIGANSTVTRDVPDYSVAVGNPARIIRRYDHTTMQWVSEPKVEKL